MKLNIKKITLLGVFTATALILSYIEALIPPIFAALPMVKIGLPNIVIIFVLYKLGFKSALSVSVTRVLMNGLLFGNAVAVIYSLAGALLSLVLMALIKKINAFSVVAVSVLGAVAHNLGQVAAAVIIMQTAAIFGLVPALSIAATLSGIIIGLVSATTIKLLKNIKI
ncbi:MAG: Gx transporter family protein [Clostridia bacterium]|nr:Gx transporter family protein [Clostridia bacterium]